MVKNINKANKSILLSLIFVMLISILITLLIWNMIFVPGSLVTYSKTEAGNASGGGGGGGGKVAIEIIPQNATNKTLNVINDTKSKNKIN